MKDTLIETKNVRAMKTASNQTIGRNGFLAVVADVGSGKTSLFNYSTSQWESKPERYAVVKMKAFRNRHSRIGIIADMMIEALEPAERVPATMERKYKLLTELLADAETKNRKVVLIIDEAQDLSLQTLRDLKKIHEISGISSHLFSIILLGKNVQKLWNGVFKGPELGYRIHLVKFDQLTLDEMILIAEQKFNLRFATDRIKERFAAAVVHRQPLGIKHLREVLENLPEFTEQRKTGGTIQVTAEVMRRLPLLSLDYRRSNAAVKHRDILEEARAIAPPGMNISLSRVSEVLNGKRDDDMAEVIRLATENSIRKAIGEKPELADAVNS